MGWMLAFGAGLFFNLWCAIVIAFPVFQVATHRMHINGDLVAIILVHGCMAMGTWIPMYKFIAKRRAYAAAHPAPFV